MEPRWLQWTRKLQAIAQTGLTYVKDPYDRERYEQLRELAVEIAAHHTGDGTDHLRALFSNETGYATPKLDVRGVVFRGDELLLVQERSDGLWTLPGGWIDVGESPALSAVREVEEESGYRTRAVKLLAVYDKRRHDHPPDPYHAHKLFFLCELLGGAPAQSVEISAVGFFAQKALPPLSLPRNTPRQLARMFEHHQHPEWPTDFD